MSSLPRIQAGPSAAERGAHRLNHGRAPYSRRRGASAVITIAVCCLAQVAYGSSDVMAYRDGERAVWTSSAQADSNAPATREREDRPVERNENIPHSNVDFEARYEELLNAINDYIFRTNLFAPYQTSPVPYVQSLVGYRLLENQGRDSKILVWLQAFAPSAGSGTTSFQAAVRLVLHLRETSGKLMVLGHDSMEIIGQGTAKYIVSQRREKLTWFDSHRTPFETLEQRKRFEGELTTYLAELVEQLDGASGDIVVGNVGSSTLHRDPQTAANIQTLLREGIFQDVTLVDRLGGLLECEVKFYLSRPNGGDRFPTLRLILMMQDGAPEIVGYRHEHDIVWRNHARRGNGTFLVLVNASNRFVAESNDVIEFVRNVYNGRTAYWSNARPVLLVGLASNAPQQVRFVRDVLKLEAEPLLSNLEKAHSSAFQSGSVPEAEQVNRLLHSIATQTDALGVVEKTPGIKVPAKVRVLAEIPAERSGISPQFARSLTIGQNYNGLWHIQLSGAVDAGPAVRGTNVFDADDQVRLKAGMNRMKFRRKTYVVYLDIYLSDRDMDISGLVEILPGHRVAPGAQYKFRYSREIRDDALRGVSEGHALNGAGWDGQGWPDLRIDIAMNYVMAMGITSGSE